MPTGQKLLDSLAETWDFFFSDVLPTLQAIFYPVQVSGPCSHGTPGPPCWPSLASLQTARPKDGHPLLPLTAVTAVCTWTCPGTSQNLPPTHEMEMRTAPSQGLGKAQSSTQ